MRIAIDARFYGGEQSKGLGRYTQKLIEYLAVIDQYNDYYVFLQENEYKHWDIKNKKFKPILAPYQWYSFEEQIFLPWKLMHYDVDFIHFPHFNVPLFYNRPFIVTIHDLILSRFPTERATTLGPVLYKVKQTAYQRIISHAARSAQKIITVSSYSKNDIIDYFKVPEKKVVVTYEATDINMVKETAEAERKKILQRYKIHKPFILYVGNAYPHKNLEVLLKVIKRLKKENKLNWHLVLVGKMDYFYRRLAQTAWAMDLDSHVIFPGFVSDRDLPNLYLEALAYIFPSRYEGFGLPPLEAMSYGTPVLSSNSSCLPEILGDAALYFDYQDVCDIIKQINCILSNKEIRKKLIIAGLKQIQSYSWKKMAEQTLQIYEQISKQK